MSDEQQFKSLYNTKVEAILGTMECRVSFVPNFLASQNAEYLEPDAIAIVDIGDVARFVRWEKESRRAQFSYQGEKYENQAIQAAERFVASIQLE